MIILLVLVLLAVSVSAGAADMYDKRTGRYIGTIQDEPKDSSAIIMGIKPPETDSPMDNRLKREQLKNAEQENELKRLQIEKARRDLQN
jgi:hypothetical protein